MRRFFTTLIILASLSSWWGCQSETTAPDPGPLPLDTTAPIATILPLDQEQLSLQFDLAFSAEDGASGVAAVEVFVRTPDQTWTSLGFHNQSPLTFVALEDGPHSFYCVAEDSAGNRMQTPDVAQAETIVPVPIIITDLQGEEFDITNAVLRYFMSVNGWGHGLGRHAIPPVNDPQFYVPGQIGYPDSDNTVEVMAMAIDGDAHAYAIGDINNREVVNDVVGGVHLSATY